MVVDVFTMVKFIERQIEKALISLLSIVTVVVSAAILGCKIVHTQVCGFLHAVHKTTNSISDKSVLFMP